MFLNKGLSFCILFSKLFFMILKILNLHSYKKRVIIVITFERNAFRRTNRGNVK